MRETSKPWYWELVLLFFFIKKMWLGDYSSHMDGQYDHIYETQLRTSHSFSLIVNFHLSACFPTTKRSCYGVLPPYPFFYLIYYAPTSLAGGSFFQDSLFPLPEFLL